MHYFVINFPSLEPEYHALQADANHFLAKWKLECKKPKGLRNENTHCYDINFCVFLLQRYKTFKKPAVVLVTMLCHLRSYNYHSVVQFVNFFVSYSFVRNCVHLYMCSFIIALLEIHVTDIPTNVLSRGGPSCDQSSL